MQSTMNDRPRSKGAALHAVAFLLAAGSAYAQVPQDRVAAQALFDEGRALYEAGNRDAACEKFAASLRIEQAVGTLLNVGECEERQDRLATAWLRYREAESLATSRGDARVRVAAESAAQLAARFGYMRIQAPAGVVVRRDGVPVDAALVGTAVPMDAGTHTIEATAAGKLPWRTSVETKNGTTTVVTIPELEPDSEAPPAALPTPGPPPEERSSPTSWTTGVVVGSVGMAVLAAGGVFGVLAMTKSAAAKDKCSATTNAAASRDQFDPATGRCYSPSAPLDEANAMKAEARTFATIANVLVPVGIVGLGVGAYLVLRRDSQKTNVLHLAPSVGGASLEGTF